MNSGLKTLACAIFLAGMGMRPDRPPMSEFGNVITAGVWYFIFGIFVVRLLFSGEE